MKIGIDLRLLGSRHGGIGRYSFEIASHILELDQKNSYTLFFNEANVNEADVSYFRKFPNVVPVVTKIRHYSIGEQTTFLRLLNKQDLDLMHFPNFNVPILYKRPFIMTLHDVVHHKISGAKKSRKLHFWAYKKVIEQAAKNSQYIITVSEYSKQDITKVLQVPKEKIRVIYEGAVLKKEVTQEQIHSIKKQFLLDKPYFLFVGVLERKKNVVNLTRGFDTFIKKYRHDAQLVIAGGVDKHYPDNKHHALDIINQDKVVFTGYVSDTELGALYAGAFAYISASLHEGFGLPGVEAMRFGLPLLVSNIPVFNEIYDNAAVYFDPLKIEDIAEKMHLLARDPQFYSQLQRNSFIRAEEFSWVKAAQETLEVYNNILR